jgi:hypothetical protein
MCAQAPTSTSLSEDHLTIPISKCIQLRHTPSLITTTILHRQLTIHGGFTDVLTHRFPHRFSESRSLSSEMYITPCRPTIRLYNFLHAGPAPSRTTSFKYGYLGSFTRHMLRSYEFGTDEVSGSDRMAVFTMHTRIHSTSFQRAEINQGPCQLYTQQYYDLARWTESAASKILIPVQGGLVNGRMTGGSLWLMGTNPGAIQTGYQKV